ncbi:DMT family transporter [Motiliproteus sp. SC1-56]|uniref:DMT family transporter n=1 Tax=Motiliproteus sp. SC1-56 TaxID=2799565 RepID=UPI001A8C9724|nr:DMT family transporter [Motiliproteus sp. SC1-56]
MHNTLLYLVTVLIWGSTWMAITFQLGVVEPVLSVAYRFALAALMLLLYCGLRRRPLRFSRRDHLFILAQGASLFGVAYWLFYLATQSLTSGLVAICFSSVVFMNVLNGRLFLGRPVRASVLAGAAVGVVGMGLVFWPELASVQAGSGALAALGTGLLGAYFASLGNILSARNQAAGVPVLQCNALGMAYGAVLMAGLAWLSGAPLAIDLGPAYLGSLFYLALFGSVIAFGCYLSLVGRIGADRAAYASLLFPIVALQLSVWFEGYLWSPASLAGIALVVVGNLLAMVSPTRWRGWLGLSARAALPGCRG